MAKGWITAEDAAKAREIKATVTAEKSATLPEQKVNSIAAGRMAKFYKEYTLLEIRGILRTLSEDKGQSICNSKRLLELIEFIKELK